MSKVKERAKLRNEMKRKKSQLIKMFGKFIDDKYVYETTAEILKLDVDELVLMQKKLNALSVPVDEKKLLERAAKRVDAE